MTVEILKLPAGPELDAFVARFVFGSSPTTPVPPYSTDMSAAWQVRKRMERLGWDSEDHQAANEEGGSYAYVFRFLRWRDARGNYLADPITEQVKAGSLDEAPAAICRAAAAAVLAFAPQAALT